MICKFLNELSGAGAGDEMRDPPRVGTREGQEAETGGPGIETARTDGDPVPGTNTDPAVTDPVTDTAGDPAVVTDTGGHDHVTEAGTGGRGSGGGAGAEAGGTGMEEGGTGTVEIEGGLPSVQSGAAQTASSTSATSGATLPTFPSPPRRETRGEKICFSFCLR